MKMYRIFLCLAGILGITLQLVNNGAGMLLFYTILSNIAVTVFLALLLLRKTPANEKLLRFKGSLTMAIMITCVVYHFLLSPTAHPKDFYTLQNLICHYFLPLGFFMDTILFDEADYRWYDPLYWAFLPLLYFAFAILNGFVLKFPIPSPDSPFPYFFLNIPKYGWTTVLQNVVFISVGYLIFGYGLWGLKRWLGKKRETR